MKLGEFMTALLAATEKAACLARTIRSEETLFKLLVQEKTGEQKNKRFVQDFKTLTDVLIQEMLKHDMEKHFPGFGQNVRGEECNEFTNTLGETVLVVVQKTEKETAELLARVLGGDVTAGKVLASVVHSSFSNVKQEEKLENLNHEIPISTTGLWVDPIDSTGQYISGLETAQSNGGIFYDGLQCVTVLVGAFHLETGEPLLGVANQPFCVRNTEKNCWIGRSIWGIAYQDLHLSSIPATFRSLDDKVNHICSKTIIISTTEDSYVKSKLSIEYKLTEAAGAGYKILCVIDNLVTSYVLSKGTTFKWDTCGPHAILLSLGGGIVDYQKMLYQIENNSAADFCDKTLQIKYDKPDSSGLTGGQIWSNSGGMIAYQDKEQLIKIVKTLETVR